MGVSADKRDAGNSDKPDMDCRENIEIFVDRFYERMLQDEQLAPIFVDVAEIDLDVHLPLIRSYWEKLLLGAKGYSRHTMNIHRALHAKRDLRAEDFERWLALFQGTVEEMYQGPGAERAKRVAGHIAANMEAATADSPSGARAG